jgi:hypothetical protein
VPTDKDNPSLLISLTQVPLIRKFILRLSELIKYPFKLIDNVMPNDYAKKAIAVLGSFGPVIALIPKRSTVLFVDWEGTIISSLHGVDGSSGRISHVLEHNGYLYFGSPFNKFMGRIVYPDVVAKQIEQVVVASKVEQIKETVKVQPSVPTTTQKPATTTTSTTTTPKPTTTTTPKPTTTTTTTTPKPTTQKPVTQPPPPPPTTTQAPKTQVPPPKQRAPKPEVPTAPEIPPIEKPEIVIHPKKPATTRDESQIPKEPAPIHESVEDVDKPKAPKMKIIKKGGVQGEL